MEEYVKLSLEIAFSGLIAALFTCLLQRKFKKYDIKYNVISDFFEYRYDLRGDRFSQALNKVYLVFSKDEKVIKAVDEFCNARNNKENNFTSNNKLYQIYFYMCKNINLKPVDEKRFCDKVFNIK